MPTITCPLCGSPVRMRRFFPPANKPFCAHCGWNLARAEGAMNAKKSLIPLVAVAMGIMGAAFAVGAANSLTPLVFLPIGFFALIATAPVAGYFSMRRAIAAARLTAHPEFAQGQPVPDPSLQYLVWLPRPRHVRFRYTAVIVAAAAGVVLFVVLLILSAEHSAPNHRPSSPLLPFLFTVITLAIVLGIPIYRDNRNVPLLRDGELAFARVHSQNQIQQGKTSYNQIAYSFQTSGGISVQGSARDLTGCVFEDMTIPVFYDPMNPSSNIPLCATYLKFADAA